MEISRSSGILMHPTSMPGKFGIGDFGSEALDWIDFIADAGFAYWQILPLGPTGYGDSPYQCFSAFAGNPYLISPEWLLEWELIDQSHINQNPAGKAEYVDYAEVIPYKVSLLDNAYRTFKQSGSEQIADGYGSFKERNLHWLDEYAFFLAIKRSRNGVSWTEWEDKIRKRSPEELAKLRKELSEDIEREKFIQYIFMLQWKQVRDHAHSRGIRIIGDLPIFVAHDSADVWANQDLFYIGEDGSPSFVAGVPPDYFSPTGQLWGNPLYRWDIHKDQDYAWWLSRMKAVLELVDLVRLDHFRGFAAYWQVPGESKTAENGEWIPAPGRDFLSHLNNALGGLPIIAEDLGVITEDVVQLRDDFQLPGMKILQFGFEGGPSDPFLPHNYPENCVVYTGTHDNDTALGWYRRVDRNSRHFFGRYLNCDSHDISWNMIRAIWSSVARLSIAPLQDFLMLGNEARMNYPGKPSGNWKWRVQSEMLTDGLQEKIVEINEIYARFNNTESGFPGE
jgi:4-alpha-glucanotransferase